MNEPRVDKEGTEVNIGDVVWIIQPNYRELVKAVIIKFTPKACKVLCENPYYGDGEPREFLVWETIKCKDQTKPDFLKNKNI